ncbi:hypothetical protein L202_04982 [Cryptococcus amylolentus CBS 6039]|uniref:Uncharacterized protein n=1 Tax=Cryptococcus amylolentus CBS 6039 TaxID=1295533 RepID=A0A1E3HNF2_9TREE|nr:hypothetical protein L202_04982 [Cryptococcus amylolentus CBS 6039]ODN77868.1 hypothetical protein L202_04982 [Cryptococcus amylolentus CBS 6039]
MGYTGPTVPSPESGNAAFWSYGYVPSLALGVIGVITFIAVAGPHLWFFVKIRGTRSVHGLLFFTAIIEALGYGARIYTHRKPFGGMSFLIGIFLIQIALILLTAAMYKSIQRLTKYTPEGRHMSPIRPRSMLVLFVILDVVWALMQVAGQYYYAAAEGAEITGAEAMFTLGMSTLIFLAGNVLQAITIIIVSIFAFVIYRRSTRIINTALANNKDIDNYPLIHPALTQVFITFGLFFVRLIMRIAEGAQGAYGYAATHEVFFGIFEYLLIILILILWAARPLKNFLPLNQTATTNSTHEDVERTAELGRNESQVEEEKA